MEGASWFGITARSLPPVMNGQWFQLWNYQGLKLIGWVSLSTKIIYRNCFKKKPKKPRKDKRNPSSWLLCVQFTVTVGLVKNPPKGSLLYPCSTNIILFFSITKCYWLVSSLLLSFFFLPVISFSDCRCLSASLTRWPQTSSSWSCRISYCSSWRNHAQVCACFVFRFNN